MSYPAHFF